MKKIILTIFISTILISGYGQSGISDSLYKIARKQSSFKQYEEAKGNLRVSISQNPRNGESLLLMGLIFSWQQQWDSARVWLNKAQIQSPKYKEVYLAQINVEKWSGQKESALEKAISSLAQFPNDKDLFYEKALAFLVLDKKEEAVNTMVELLSLYPDFGKASDLLLTIRKSGIINKISLEYDFSFFEKPYIKRWHYLSLIYERRLKFGSIIAKINTADYLANNDQLFATNAGIQYEIEAYPRITKKDYLYLDYGYSPSRIFPRSRVGVEWFHAFPFKAEISGGFRYLNFPNATGNPDVWVYTGSASKYYQNYLFSLRGFFSSPGTKYSQSYLLSIRRYFKNPLNYIYTMGLYGISPDNQFFSTYYQPSTMLSSKGIKIGGQQMINSRWYFSYEMGYQFQEYSVSSYRNNYDFKLRAGLFF